MARRNTKPAFQLNNIARKTVRFGPYSISATSDRHKYVGFGTTQFIGTGLLFHARISTLLPSLIVAIDFVRRGLAGFGTERLSQPDNYIAI